ncbi:MAG: flagellar assembly peptidoglycan hydrolase FlgJ [Legionella sp.]|nr:flagellar assembly peptidoglycan hydrolase FlgJ [Legionella sp.]
MTVQGIVTSDFGALSELKAQASHDAKGALPEVAKQFEGIFLQSMLKSMRMGHHFLDDSSPLRGKDRETFEDMLDAQYASNIANTKSIGLADMLAKNLNNELAAQNNDPNRFSSSVDLPATPVSAYAGNKQFTEMDKDKPATSVDDFVKSIWPKAKEAASVLGLDPKILMAQAALETGWGKFITKDTDGTSSNNLFNIKATNNSEYESVSVKTTEYIADTPIKMNASFKKYPSIEQSFNDYITLIKGNDRYQSAVANAGNPENYVNELHKAGYATDPQYGTKILSIYRGDELNQAMQRCGLSEQI